MRFRKVIKDWMLPIAMVAGASMYLIYHVLPEPIHKAGPVLADIVALMQPMLIFAMLFLTFCRIEPKDLKPHRWHWWLLLVQGGIFILLGLAAFLIQKVIVIGICRGNTSGNQIQPIRGFWSDNPKGGELVIITLVSVIS